MTGCKQWEERVALAAGGDLCDADCAAVELHVAACAPCALLLEELRESLGLLPRSRHENGQ